LHYLLLSLWPHPLVLDYGTAVVTDFREVAWPALILAALAAATLIAWRKRQPVGFAGLWFFGILAPSSSVVPLVEQTMSEHRVYLPSIAVVAIAVVALQRLIGRRSRVAFGLIALAEILTTFSRNAAYRSELAIWTDTVIKNPASWRAHHNLGFSYADRGNMPRAIIHLEQSLKYRPDSPLVHGNLGLAYRELGRAADAVPHFEAALRLQPVFPNVSANLGLALLDLGKLTEALVRFQDALHAEPNHAVALYGLGDALSRLGRFPEAIDAYQRSLQIRPDDFAALVNLGVAFENIGRFDLAAARYQRAVEIRPSAAVAHLNLASTLAKLGRDAEARAHFEAAQRLDPKLPQPAGAAKP
jgi:tetratricopeptide (TPR) repeat protein